MQWERSYDRTAAYGQSKLANLMFAYELQRRLAARGTTVAVTAHPGLANTDLVRNSPAALRLLAPVIAPLITQTPAMGALPTLRAATDPGVLGGQYYDWIALRRPIGLARDLASHVGHLQVEAWT